MIIYSSIDKRAQSHQIGSELSHEEIQGAIQGERDYVAYDQVNQIGIAELNGRRFTQEDRVCFGKIKNFHKLSSENKKITLQQTILELQKSCGNFSEQGSSLLYCIIDDDTIYTAALGDSTAFLIGYDPDHLDKANIEMLNTLLHNPSTDNAKLRKQEGLFDNLQVSMGRIAGVLALSRAIGDTAYESYGLIHHPDIYQTKLDFKRYPKYVLILACDGLTESDCLDEEEIKALILGDLKKSVTEVAFTLANAAYCKGSYDNISVLVTNIEAAQSRNLYLAVFDGHGGSDVSECLKRRFSHTLEEQIQKQ